MESQQNSSVCFPERAATRSGPGSPLERAVSLHPYAQRGSVIESYLVEIWPWGESFPGLKVRSQLARRGESCTAALGQGSRRLGAATPAECRGRVALHGWASESRGVLLQPTAPATPAAAAAARPPPPPATPPATLRPALPLPPPQPPPLGLLSPLLLPRCWRISGRTWPSRPTVVRSPSPSAWNLRLRSGLSPAPLASSPSSLVV